MLACLFDYFSHQIHAPNAASDAHRIGVRTAETSEVLASAEVKACKHDGRTDGENALLSNSRKLSDKDHHSEVTPK